MAEKKEKQYVSDNARLMAEWDWEKNSELDPTQLTLGSNKKAWWKCKEEHTWEAKIANRNLGKGCPYCSGRYAIKGKNDLLTSNPLLATEWNYEKNEGLKPDEVMPNSHNVVWWKCSNGHEWQARISDRHKGHGCLYCTGQKALIGVNDLKTINPALALEWNYKKNIELTPEEILPNSSKMVWWICKKGHEWQATVNSRNRGNGCPICSSEQNTSFPEFAIIYYLKKYGIDTIHSYRDNGYELDIYIPSKKIAIEYDGYYWHKDKKHQDLNKNFCCQVDGIKLYRIREGLPPLNDSSIDYIIQKNQKDLSKIVTELLFEILGITVKVDIKEDTVSIECLRELKEKENSIIFSNPKLSTEWNYEKNGNLKPEYYASNSGKKVWWKCDLGHEWQATIDTRNKGHGCPFCTGQKIFAGFNDLQTISPQLANEWNYEKNKEINPENISAGTHKKVWWKCSKGHEWEAGINQRARGTGCPYCSGRYAIKGKNDLQTVNPTLAKEWNHEKNKGLTPDEVMPNSNKKVWWICSNNHEWKAQINSRTRGNGCPYCSGHFVIRGENDLQSLNPTLANEWNYEKNEGLKPDEVMPNSHKKVWWKCSHGHEWKADIGSRNRGNGCPECAKEKRRKKNI